MSLEHTAKNGRVCLVTVGATVPFRRLLEEVLDLNFIEVLEKMGFDTIYLQTHPDDVDWATKTVELLKTETKIEFKIFGYFSPDALSHVIQLCRGEWVKPARTGVVISHGGSGNIMEVHRQEAPLVLRANTDLLNNHQQETIDAAVEKGWAVQAVPGALHEAVVRAMKSVGKELGEGLTDALENFTLSPKMRFAAGAGGWSE